MKQGESILERWNNGRLKDQPDGRETEKREMNRKRDHVPHMHVPVHVRCVVLCLLLPSSVCVCTRLRKPPFICFKD